MMAVPSLPFRIAEANSVYGEGQRGVSDTFGAALWGAGLMFQLAAAGAAGVNFHAGKRVLVITAGLRRRIFVVGEKVLAFGDELAGAFVHHWNDRVFEKLLPKSGCFNARYTASNFRSQDRTTSEFF
jgi:hypothetical protein